MKNVSYVLNVLDIRCCYGKRKALSIFRRIFHIKYGFVFLYNFCLKHFSFYEELGEIWPKMYIGLHVKCLLELPNFNATWICSTFSKNTHANLSSRSPAVSCGLMDGQWDRHTDTHDEADSRISQFCKSVLKLEHIIVASLRRPHSLVFAAAHFLLLKHQFCSNYANCYRHAQCVRARMSHEVLLRQLA